MPPPDVVTDTAWTRRTATPGHVGSLWRQLRNPMSATASTAFLSFKDALDLDNATKPKFLNLKVFWIKLLDFMDIVPRHPHLTGISLLTRLITLHDLPFGKPKTPVSSAGHGASGGSPLLNGNLTNGT